MSIQYFVRTVSARLMPLAIGLGTAWAAELQVPAFTAYTLPDTDSPRISERGGVRGWTDPANSVHWYGRLNQPGTLQAKLRLKLPEGAESKLRLTVAGGFREVTVRGASGPEPVTADFGAFTIERPGYQDFHLGSLNPKGQDAGQLEALVLDGPAVEGAHFNLKERRNAASVHLSYKASTHAIAAFYCEVTAVEEPVTTFYMACGWHRGYFGMQVNSPTERRIIFSVWDSGDEAVDRNKVSAEKRVQLMGKGDGVYSATKAPAATATSSTRGRPARRSASWSRPSRPTRPSPSIPGTTTTPTATGGCSSHRGRPRARADGCAAPTASARTSGATPVTCPARRCMAANGSAPRTANGSRSPRRASATTPPARATGSTASWAWNRGSSS
jgi:hypothetical protein